MKYLEVEVNPIARAEVLLPAQIGRLKWPAANRVQFCVDCAAKERKFPYPRRSKVIQFALVQEHRLLPRRPPANKRLLACFDHIS